MLTSACVLVLQRLQPLDLKHLEAAELGFSFIDAGIAAAVLAAKLEDGVPMALRGNSLAVARIAFRLLSAVAAREIPPNVAIAKWSHGG